MDLRIQVRCRDPETSATPRRPACGIPRSSSAQRPVLVAEACGPDDVRAVVLWAREHDVPLAVQSTGHAGPGIERPAQQIRHRGDRRHVRTPRRSLPARTSTTEGHLMNEILQLGQRWAEAEQRGDVAALEAMTVGNFTLVGPLGFVLDKGQWLDRYRTGQLVTSSLVWEDVHVREYGDGAVSIGRHTQQANYRGQPSDGQFRATHVAVKVDGQWQLASMQLSPLGQFRPPTSG